MALSETRAAWNTVGSYDQNLSDFVSDTFKESRRRDQAWYEDEDETATVARTYAAAVARGARAIAGAALGLPYRDGVARLGLGESPSPLRRVAQGGIEVLRDGEWTTVRPIPQGLDEAPRGELVQALHAWNDPCVQGSWTPAEKAAAEVVWALLEWEGPHYRD